MSLNIRRLTMLLGSVVVAIILAACSESPSAISGTKQLTPAAPSFGNAQPLICDANGRNCVPCQLSQCVGLPGDGVVTREDLEVCKMYPAGTVNPPAVNVQLDVTTTNITLSPKNIVFTIQPNTCLILWRNGEHIGPAPDYVKVTELVPAGYTATSQVTTAVRIGPAIPPEVYDTTRYASTNATVVTGIIGGPQKPGMLVVFTNTKINEPPTPIHNGPYTQVEGSVVTFNTTGTSDPDGDVLTYSWTFGDGGTGTGSNPTHVYADNGVYPVTLTVDDGHNPPVTVNTTSTITNLPPVPTLTTSTPNVSCGQNGLVTSTFTDPGIIDMLWSYDIDWGDGSAHSTGTTSTQAGTIPGSHLYAANGTYTVTIKVTDKDGGMGSATTQITMNCAPPPPPPPPGASCGYTQGYWKNHESAWPAPYSPNAQWLSATHKVTGVTWDGLMGMSVKGGNSYMQLAHQWIAATLNRGTGAPMSASVVTVLNQGEAWLIANTPALTSSVPNLKNAQATAWASVLDDYNNGRLGTPHCD